MTFYLDIQKTLVKPEVKELLVSWAKPHKPAVSGVVSRWIKGNNINWHKEHVRGSLSSNKVREIGISVCDILVKSCWKKIQ